MHLSRFFEYQRNAVELCVMKYIFKFKIYTLKCLSQLKSIAIYLSIKGRCHNTEHNNTQNNNKEPRRLARTILCVLCHVYCCLCRVSFTQLGVNEFLSFKFFFQMFPIFYLKSFSLCQTKKGRKKVIFRNKQFET